MQVITSDIVVVGAGGTGLRAAIAAAEKDPSLNVALLSKVYPMRSHTVAAEGGAAGVVSDNDSLENHFKDTVAGGDWLCDQDAVDYFIAQCTPELVRMEHWGCPWSRKEDGSVLVRPFGGMKVPRTWFASDKSGFHMLHTLFQTSIKYPSIHRYDEFFCTDLIVEDGRCQGVVAIEIKTGETFLFIGKSVILGTGGAGRLFQFNTNGGIVTGDGMSMAMRAGVPLRDMEFFQFHPTGLPGTGILMTEACRGEGGLMLNKDGYRYLQDYGLGPETPVGEPKSKYMELGPRDRLSQAFWHESQKGRTIQHPKFGEVVNLDMTHMGRKKLMDRLPMISSLSLKYLGVDPVVEPIPVRPVIHYTMGGIQTNGRTLTQLPGLYAAGECASVGIHGANRLGSNSLVEILVFGRVAGDEAVDFAKSNRVSHPNALLEKAEASINRIHELRDRNGKEKASHIRHELVACMDKYFGIYRTEDEMSAGIDKIVELKDRFKRIGVTDKTDAFNTELLQTLELESGLEVAHAAGLSAIKRKESRGSHQRIDGYEKRDDENFLKHSLAFYQEDAEPRIDYQTVNITRFLPEERTYGAAGEGKH